MRTCEISPCPHLQPPVFLTQLTICLSLTGLPQSLCICHPSLIQGSFQMSPPLRSPP